MSENKAEIIAGAIVLTAAAGFFFYMTQIAGVTAGTGSGRELFASFRSVEGITVGSDVRMAGVRVGTVTQLDLNPQTFRADATFSVQKSIEIPDDSSVQISSEGLLGGSFVELVPGGSPFNLEPGAEIENTQGAVSLISLLIKFVAGDKSE